MDTKVEISCTGYKLSALDPVIVTIDGESLAGQVVGISRDGIQVGYRNNVGQYVKVWVEKHNVTRYE